MQNGTKKVTVKNGLLLDKLREIEPGEWKKVYKMDIQMAMKYQFIISNIQKQEKCLMSK